MKFSILQDWLDWQTELHSQSIDMGLDRIRPVFSRLLSNEQVSSEQISNSLAKKVILVAGTNGKGSTVAFLESLYVSGGYRVGTYTSPHLLKYNERVRIDGEPVSDAQLCEAFDHVENAREETTLTYFEFGTFAAFDVFQRDQLDIVILEVGLGGRLDVVNLVDADVAVISNIQLDHMDWLGDTREEIALEKLGVARRGKPLIIADDDLPENVLPYINENELSAFILGKDFGFSFTNESWDWWSDAGGSKRVQKHSLPLPSLRGAHQFKNASAALTVAGLINSELPLSMNHIRVGLSNASLPGRFQIERVNDKTVILDVAHNPHGIRAFLKNLKMMPALGENYLVFAMLKDKSLEEVIALLDDEVDHWLSAGIDSERALSESVLADLVSKNTKKALSINQFSNVADACNNALKKMQPNDHLLVVGSFFTVADGLKSLSSHNSQNL